MGLFRSGQSARDGLFVGPERIFAQTEAGMQESLVFPARSIEVLQQRDQGGAVEGRELFLDLAPRDLRSWRLIGGHLDGLLVREEPGDCRHRQPQFEGLIGKALEFVASIEALRLLVLGIEQDRHDPDVAGGAKHPVEGIQEEILSQAASLKLPVYREACKARDRDREAWEALRRVRRQILPVDRTRRNRVVAQHLPWPVASRCDEGFRDARFMVLACKARQVLVEGLLPTGKVASIVGFRQRSDPPAIAHRASSGGSGNASPPPRVSGAGARAFRDRKGTRASPAPSESAFRVRPQPLWLVLPRSRRETPTTTCRNKTRHGRAVPSTRRKHEGRCARRARWWKWSWVCLRRHCSTCTEY